MGGLMKIIGKNRRFYPIEPIFEEIPPQDRMFPTTVVLVEGEIGDYAAYIGHGRPEWIAQFGDKISFEEACIHFPSGQLKKQLYRD